MLNIKLIEGEYDINSWLDAVRGLEDEPEKGRRCSVCFDKRFEVTIKKAYELKERSFTSTLLMSPKKSLKQLKKSGDELGERYNIKFIAPDYRKSSGTQEQNILAKRDKLYRQDYCGCIYGLTKQREEQKKLADELFSPISNQIQPSSIDEKVALYKKRLEYEDRGIDYKIVKNRFLNWRLKFGYLKVKKRVVPSHILPYSTLKRDYSRGKIDYSINNIYYMNRDDIKFISLDFYNYLSNRNYHKMEDLIFNPPTFNQELVIRQKLIKNNYDLSLILIVKEIPTNTIEIVCQSYIYGDMREELIEV